MEIEIRRILWISLLIGCAFGVGIGIAAGDRGMVEGAISMGIGGAVMAPFVARFWARRGSPMG